VPSVTILAQDVDCLVENYHTRLDSLDRVRPEALARILNLVVEMIVRIDKAAGEADGVGL
jgi:aminopeptidase-like protein